MISSRTCFIPNVLRVLLLTGLEVTPELDLDTLVERLVGVSISSDDTEPRMLIDALCQGIEECRRCLDIQAAAKAVHCADYDGVVVAEILATDCAQLVRTCDALSVKK